MKAYGTRTGKYCTAAYCCGPDKKQQGHTPKGRERQKAKLECKAGKESSPSKKTLRTASLKAQS